MATDTRRIAAENWEAFWRAHESTGHNEWLEMAQKCDDFYYGKQWSEADKKKLESLGRPALTLNEILQVVNAIRGHYSDTRADIVAKPRGNGATVEVAETLTKLIDVVLERNAYVEDKEPQLFEDGIIEDRGFLDIRMDYSDNVLGEVKITVDDPRNVVPDPDAKQYDPDTWSEVSSYSWMSLDDIEAYYGKENRKKLEASAAGSGQILSNESFQFERTFGGTSLVLPVDYTTDKRIKSVRVVERQYKKMGMLREFVELSSGATRPVPEHWDEERVAAVMSAYGLVIRKRVAQRIRWTVSADGVLLFDEWSPYTRFTKVPYFPIFRRGRPSGIVRHLIDPQTQLNKIESQVLHVINTTANSGWKAEAGSLVNMTTEELEERGAETGLVLVYGKNRTPPEKIEPNRIPQGLEQYAAKSMQYIQNIPGAAALLGTAAQPRVSGVVLDKAESKALLGLQVVFDNLQRTRRLVGQRIIECIQTFYTEPRIYRHTNWRDTEQPTDDIAINQQVAGEIINNVTLGEYDIVVGTAPARDTMEETQFAEALQLRENDIPIPAYRVVLASHLAGKREIAEEVKQLEGLGEPTEAQLMMQQFELRKLAAEVAEMEAKAFNLRAQAGLTQVKTETEVAAEQREMFDVIKRYEMEVARLRADLEKKEADIVNKLQLAEMHTGSKNALTRYTTLMKGMQQERQADAEMRKEAMRLRNSNAQQPQARSR